ncbi:uncharacterized protein EI90DRAFT_3122564 [Cantharellus anzutake]|uniref:uncharacterized protein n=1 Tax=Cantharellus anzutake TaxID=1750568 RepID=UPI001904E587|nr:uncharacterized protein EI90DRAFT_3122564 [Cantharellus anzutake]KAF8332820.1 hypothetical protein EI90DRAFT_3122564 [Cantharellus anzutake]
MYSRLSPSHLLRKTFRPPIFYAHGSASSSFRPSSSSQSSPNNSGHTTTKSSNEPTSNLSDAKLRLLTSLYHQGGEFVTPENLDQKFHEAFVPKMAMDAGRQIFNYSSLEQAVEGRRSLPHLRPAPIFHMSASEKRDTPASYVVSTPSARVMAETVAAMAGTTVIGSHAGFVGLEIVKEELAQRVKEETQNSEDSSATSKDPSL